MRRKFDNLPDEIILTIFAQVAPRSLSNLARTCKLFQRLTTEPRLWKDACLSEYKFWDPSRDIKSKSSDTTHLLDWKAIYTERCTTDRETLRLLNSVLSHQNGRISRIHDIGKIGYESKDILRRQIALRDEGDDGLCRSYYSKAALGHIHRKIGIAEWKKIDGDASAQYDRLERVLTSFDMFILEDREGDLDQISLQLDVLAKEFRASGKSGEDLSIRARALNIATFLRARGFAGIAQSAEYHDLRHNFLGLSLQSVTHSCLPLVSVAIYCAIARRLGLDARPCGFPFHVHAIVRSPSRISLDSTGAKEISLDSSECMYLDPARTDAEVLATDLIAQLQSVGTSASDMSPFLASCSTAELVQRAARNIAKSIRVLDESNAIGRQILPSISSPSSTTMHGMMPSKSDALYGALWANLVLQGPVRRQQYLQFLLDEMSIHFPWDINIMVDYANSTENFEGSPEIQEALDSIQSTDRMSRKVKRRSEMDPQNHVMYKIGQVFQHERYGYVAVIIGWDTCCKADEEWIQRMSVDSLPDGRTQSFYHVLSWDENARYVAQENINTKTRNYTKTENDWLEPLLRFAGKYFKRWDNTTHSFISNIRDEYPDD